MYKNGQAVEVTINEMSEDGKKMTLALDGAAAGTGPAGGDSGSGSLEGSGFTAGKWLQGEVQSVSSFGLFVRPAGTEVTGLIHMSQIPRDLISALKKRSSAQPSGNQTDVEMLFQKGDVVSCRINSYGGPKKIDMSMLPPKNEEDDDDYVVDGRDPEEAEPKEGPDGQQRRPRGEVKTGGIDSESIEVFNGEKKLLWWKGESYVPTPEFALSEDQQENEITKESKSLVEGTWRRMFELDLRKDEAEFSSKVNDKELKELQEDIGELMGLDDDMFAEPETLSLSISRPKVGTFQVGSLDGLPDDWRKEMEFFKELEGAETTTMAMMRAGKASDQSEFDGVVRTVEADIQSKSPRREAPAPAPVVTVEEVPVETPVAEAPTEETAAPESASADA